MIEHFRIIYIHAQTNPTGTQAPSHGREHKITGRQSAIHTEWLDIFLPDNINQTGGVIIHIEFFISQKGGRDSLRSKISEIVAQGRETVREAIEEGKEAAAQKEAEFQAGLHKEDD